MSPLLFLMHCLVPQPGILFHEQNGYLRAIRVRQSDNVFVIHGVSKLTFAEEPKEATDA